MPSNPQPLMDRPEMPPGHPDSQQAKPEAQRSKPKQTRLVRERTPSDPYSPKVALI
jgi:hypothetical protein